MASFSRRDAKKLLLPINKQQSLLQFKISIVDSLLKVGKCDYKKRGRKSDNEENFQKKEKNVKCNSSNSTKRYSIGQHWSFASS